MEETQKEARQDVQGACDSSQSQKHHWLIDQLIAYEFGGDYWCSHTLNDSSEGKAISDLKGEEAAAFLCVCFSRFLETRQQRDELQARLNTHRALVVRWCCEDLIVRQFLRRKLPLNRQQVLTLIAGLTSCEGRDVDSMPVASIISSVENYLVNNEADEEPLDGLATIRKKIGSLYDTPDRRRMIQRLLVLDKTESQTLRLTPGEAWSDDALAYCEKSEAGSAWVGLLNYCQSSSASKPSAKWLKKAATYVEDVGENLFEDRCRHWFDLVDKPRTRPPQEQTQWASRMHLMLDEGNADILKGLVWCCAIKESAGLASALVRLALSCYKKVPGVGPRAVRIGNACIFSLSNMPGRAGLYQLAVLKVKTKYRSALNMLNSALSEAAQREGISVTELEEIGVPSYGLDEVGFGEETVGDFTAVVRVPSLRSVELIWKKPDGEARKTVPAQIKESFPAELKELKGTLKDIKSMISIQKDRIEQLFLEERTWRYHVWQERYLNHPIVGLICRNLVWQFSSGSEVCLGIFHSGKMMDASGRALNNLSDEWSVSLWHPITSSVDEVKLWRAQLEKLQISQPFKQVHREIYVLTDAEMSTEKYSNRFASHIIKQHQFSTLASARGWRYSLRGYWDGGGDIAELRLDDYNLRAEFWVSPIGDSVDDATEAGIYKYMSTDQVRFYKINESGGDLSERDSQGRLVASLEEVPPLVLSEVFRDVDLFVGVCSVGNNPDWSDGGPDGRFYDYWHSFSFGDLSASAITRKEVLQRLIPKLKFGSQCHFIEKFLVVEGERRTYKIHLGSGNILMEPNNQYLCIVSDGKKNSIADKLFLPFEGDQLVSVILSKAVLLANDTKISDATINSQIDCSG